MKKFILSILILTSTSLYAQCEGDLNGDGVKNVIDIVALVNQIISGDTECEEESVHGCLDSQACNYDSTAMIDNNSCYYCYNDDCDTYPENLFDCDGICLVESDCLGVCNGDATIDDCGVCDGNNTDMDCLGECFGNAVEDCCGDCNGGEVSDEGYACSDIQALQDIIDANSTLYGIAPLDLGYATCGNNAQIWEDGRLVELCVQNYGNTTIYNIPFSFTQLTELRKLRFENNNINNLSSLENIFSLNNIEELYLHDNNITELPDNIGGSTSLKKIAIYNNSISLIPQSIGDLENLEIPEIGNNQLTAVPDAICNLINLTKLDFYDNSISYIPEDIGNLVNLETLEFQYNELTYLPESICDTGANIYVTGNMLCYEYYFDCIYSWGNQNSSNCP